jgi:hypothetical protein
MKKILLLTAVLFLLQVQVLFSQKLTEEQIPTSVKQNFSEKYKDVKVKWMKNDDGDFEGTFKQNKKEITVVYNNDGKLLETQIETDLKELPSDIITFIFENYKGYEFKETQKVERTNGTTYRLELEDKKNKKLAALTFDKNGVVKEEVLKDEK